MLWQRARHQSSLQDSGSGALTYILCDASPQGGREWFVTELHVVTAEGFGCDWNLFFEACIHYQSTQAAAWELGSEWRAMAEAERRTSSEQMADRRSQLSKCLDVMVLLPVGLGHCRSDIIHKCTR